MHRLKNIQNTTKDGSSSNSSSEPQGAETTSKRRIRIIESSKILFYQFYYSTIHAQRYYSTKFTHLYIFNMSRSVERHDLLVKATMKMFSYKASRAL